MMRLCNCLLRDTPAVDETGYHTLVVLEQATSNNLMGPVVHHLRLLGEAGRSDLGVLRSVRALGFKI